MPKSTREALEAAMTGLEAALGEALGAQAGAVLRELRDLPPEEVAARLQSPDLLPGLGREVEGILRQRMAEMALLGAGDAAAELVEVRFDLPPAEAFAWADRHAAELVRGVDENTRALLRDTVARAMRRPGGVDYAGLADKVQELLTTDAEWRARRIALTEPVLAYHNGSIQAYYASNQVWGRRWVAGQAGACAVCRALHDQVVRLGEPFRVTVDGKEVVVEEGELPHPHCRCRESAVTNSQAKQNGWI